MRNVFTFALEINAEGDQSTAMNGGCLEAVIKSPPVSNISKQSQ